MLTALKALGSTLATRRMLRRLLATSDRQAAALEQIAGELATWRREREAANPDLASQRAREAVVSGRALPEGEIEDNHAQAAQFEQIADELFRRLGRMPTPEQIIEEFDRLLELEATEERPARAVDAGSTSPFMPPASSAFGRAGGWEGSSTGPAGGSLMDPASPAGLSTAASPAAPSTAAPPSEALVDGE